MATMDNATFTLYMALIASGMTCIGLFLNFVIRSRCERLSCCGRECIVRNVLPAEQAQMDFTQIPTRAMNIPNVGPVGTRT